MKINLLILGLLIFASTSWPVQTFTIEDDDLSAVPGNAEVVIRSSEVKDDDLQNCELVGKAVDLDGHGQTIDLIVTMRDAAGWGAALGPIWVLRGDGDSFVIVLSDGGYSVTIGKAKHKGLYDITISAETAGWSRQSIWEFNGKRYKKTKEKTNRAY
jgi:hypothetical protein